MWTLVPLFYVSAALWFAQYYSFSTCAGVLCCGSSASYFFELHDTWLSQMIIIIVNIILKSLAQLDPSREQPLTCYFQGKYLTARPLGWCLTWGWGIGSKTSRPSGWCVTWGWGRCLTWGWGIGSKMWPLGHKGGVWHGAEGGVWHGTEGLVVRWCLTWGWGIGSKVVSDMGLRVVSDMGLRDW